MAERDFYLKIDGIEGESKDDKHKNEIEITSWNWGARQAGSSGIGGGSSSGKVSMDNFSFSMVVNRASPKLMLACATGQSIAKAILTCRKAGGTAQAYLKYTMHNFIVASYETGAGSGILPEDRISLNFSKIEVEYQEQDDKGMVGKPVNAGYDLKLGKKV